MPLIKNSRPDGQSRTARIAQDQSQVAGFQNAAYAASGPINQSDWPLPQWRPARPFDVGVGAFAPASVATTPFGQTEWPNPVRFVPRTFALYDPGAKGFFPVLATGQSPSVATFDYPNPTRRMSAVYSPLYDAGINAFAPPPPPVATSPTIIRRHGHPHHALTPLAN